jgi:glycosyltransferase involved in cell wall biosynthesis
METRRMKVSVIIPTYNRGYIIRDALESALSQTYQNFELIVVDDGSADDTRAVVESLQSDKIRYLRHETNRGNGAACNNGLRSATGDAIAFLDSDDMWTPQNLEREVSFLERHPEVDAVFTDARIVEGQQVTPSLISLMRIFPQLLAKKPKSDEYVLSNREMYLCLLEEVPIKPTTMLARRALYDRTGFFNESWPFADWDLFLRFSHSCSFGYIDSPLAVQRRTGDAIHQKFREQDKLFLLRICLNEKLSLKRDPEALNAVNRGISSHCLNLAGFYLESGNPGKSLRVYLQGFKETKQPGMLLRAASTMMPSGLRNFVRSALGRA